MGVAAAVGGPSARRLASSKPGEEPRQETWRGPVMSTARHPLTVPRLDA